MSRDHRFVGSAKLISMLTMASRVLGVVREMAYGFCFGASPLLSDFRIAFQIPNLARRLFGEGALTSSFIPVFTKCRQKEGDNAAKQLAGGVLSLVVVILTALTVLAEVGLLIAESHQPHPAVRLTMILMPYTVLICGTALLAGVLNSLHRFAAPALAPMLLNVVLIGATWLGGEVFHLQPEPHLQLIAWCALVAGVLQIAIQIVWLRRCGFSIRPNLNWSSPGVRRVVTLILPMILGVSAIQLNTFIDSIIAYAFVSDGRGLAILGYAQYLSHLPLGVFSTAIATAIFPMLSQRSAEGDMRGFAKTLEAGIRTSLFIAIPAGVGLILIAPMLIRVLFERGQFEAADTQRVAAALGCYCLGLWAYSTQQILVRGYYAIENMKTPVRISLVMVGLNLMLNLILVRTSLREAGVALATAISATIQVALLALCLGKRVCVISWGPIAVAVIKSVFAAAIMGGVVWALSESSATGRSIPVNDWVRLILCVLAGALTYTFTAKLTRADELGVLMGRK